MSSSCIDAQSRDDDEAGAVVRETERQENKTPRVDHSVRKQLCVLRSLTTHGHVKRSRSENVAILGGIAPELSLFPLAQAQRLRLHEKRSGLEPLAEVQRALLVVE
eukprot:1402560-Rhodomonas_salina.1